MHATSTTAPRTVPARTSSSSSSADMLVSPLKITFVTLWLVTIVGGLAVDVTIDVVQDRYASFPLTLALAFSVSLTLLALLMTALLGRWVQRGFALYQPFVGGDVFVCLQACGYALVTVATALKVVLASEAQHRRHYYYGAFAVLGVFVTAAQVVLMLSLQYFRPPRCHRRARRSKVREQQQQQQQQQQHDSSSSSDDDDDDSAHTTRLSRVLRNMTPSPRREVLLLTLLMPIEVASAVAAEHYHSYGRVAVVLTWLFVGASMTILHTCVARPFLPRSYHVVLRPFALPSWRLSAMQLCANALLLTCLSGNVVLYTLHPLTPPSWHLACALAAVTAMCTHLLLLRRLGLTLAPHASTRAADAAAMLMPDVTTTTTATAALQTPLLASLVSVVCSALVYGSVLTTSLRRTSSTSSQTTTTTTTTTMSPLQPQQHSSEQHYEAAVVQVQWVLSALLFALPPFTHLQGRVAFGARYAMYQPFGGDVDFVLLHAAAWTAYAIGIFLATLHASAHTRSEFLLLYVTCLLLAQLFVHAALHVFHRQQQQQQQTTSHHADTTAATPPHDVSASTDATNKNNNDKNDDDDDGHVVRAHARDKSTHTTQLLTMVMNGNMLLAIVLGTVSVLLRAVCDGMMLRNGSTSDSTSGNGGVSQPVRALARAATVLSLLATPIAQLSMQHQHHHSNSDDDDADNDDDAVATPSRQRGRAGASARHVVAVAVGGGGGCAALQAISWLLYSFVVLAAVLSECASAHGTDDARTRRHHAHNNNNYNNKYNKYNSGESRAGMTIGRVRWAAGYVPMQYTYVGLLCGVPQLCVLLCSFLYAQARVQYTRRAARVRHATVQLRTTMQRHGVVGDDWRRCEQLLRLLAGDDNDDNDDDNHADDTHNDHTATAAVAAAASDAPPALPRGHRRRLVTRASSPSAMAAREAAQCLVGVMCLVCLVSFLGAVYVADVPPATTLAFVLAGLASLSLSCFSLHGVYGARMHGHSKSSGSNNNDDDDDDDDSGRGGAYTLFMPFVGGTRFVLEQATGWASYTACVCLGIACLVDGHAAPRVCVTLSLLSVVSQVALLHSIDCFDTAAAADVRHSIIGRNADALLAVCTLLGTFAFARAYDARRGGVVARAAHTVATTTVTTTVTSTHDERDALSLVPVVLVGIALTLSVPLGLVSLQRQAERYGMPLRTLLHGRSERASDGRRRQRRRSGGDDDDDAANSQQRQPSLHRVTASQRHNDDDDNDRGDANDAATAATMTPPLPHVRRQSTTTTMSSSSSLSSSFAAAAASSSHDSTATATTTTATTHERDGSYYDDDDDDDDDDDGSSSVRDGVDDASSTATAASSRRRRRRWQQQQQQQQQRRRRRRGALGVTYTLAVLVGALLAVLMPFAVLLLAYACVRAAAPVYAVAVRAISLLVGAFALVLLLPLIAAPALHHSRVLRNVHSALCCWLLYSIPTIVVLSALTPLLVHTRGAWLTAANMVLVSVFSVIPCVHVLGYVLSVACLGHMLQHHVYVCAYAHRERLAWRAALSDVVVALLWVCYMQRYHGQPHWTGRYYSDRAVRFFQRYLFRGMAHYFSLRVVVCDGVVGSGDNNDEKGDALQTRVCLNNNNNNNNDNSDTSSPQYVFSMHPHGIFPMSAAYVPHTVQWERKVGCGRRRDNNKSNNKNNNDKNNKNKNNNNNNNKNNTMTTRTHFVSTHAADVMFSVPLLRDVVMCLGGMSVSRRAIEHSLCSGNSPLIVTGGQSEMLLMRRSATEMHLLCSHVGFIRVALQHRVPLVPIIAFAENNVLDMVHWPRLQRWCLRRVAFPLPVLPYGRWWLPLPTTQPMTIVVGRALWPRHGRDNADDVACVREMQYRYFAHLEWLFYTYRRTAGYPHMKLYLHNGVDDVGHTATPRPRDDNNDNDDDTRAAEAAVGSVSDHDGDDDEERQMWLHYRSAVPDALRFRLDDDDNDNSEERAVPALDKKAQ